MCADPALTIPLIAAGSALAGVIVSQAATAILAWIGRKHQRQVLLREKYEQLAHHVADAVADYLQLLTANTNLELLAFSRPTHAHLAYVLARLYFPEIKPFAESFLASIVAFQKALSVNYNPNSPDNVAIQGTASEKVKAAQMKLQETNRALELAIEEHSSKYAIA